MRPTAAPASDLDRDALVGAVNGHSIGRANAKLAHGAYGNERHMCRAAYKDKQCERAKK